MKGNISYEEACASGDLTDYNDNDAEEDSDEDKEEE